MSVKQQRIYEELEFTDDFLFGKILYDNPNLCKELLEIILQQKIKKIVYLNKEQEFRETYDSHGIRMDVYMEDDANTVYDLEMQTTIQKNLGIAYGRRNQENLSQCERRNRRYIRGFAKFFTVYEAP